MLPVGRAERELFPGLLLTTGALVGLVIGLRRSRTEGASAGSAPSTAVIYATIVGLGFALTLGPEPALGRLWRFETGPWEWLSAVLPGFDGLRVPARFAVVVYLGLSVLAALGFARLLGRISRRHRRLSVVGAAIVIIAEGWSAPIALPRFPTPDMAVERAAYEWTATQPSGPMAELPVGDTAEGTRYLYWTLTHGNRIVNGYSGYGWPLEHFIGGPPSTEPSQAGELLRLGRALGLRYIVLHEHLYADQRQGEEMARAIAANTGHVQEARSFGTTWVYALKPMGWSRRVPRGRPVTEAFRMSASRNPGALRLMVDTDPATRWLSGPPQDGTEWVEVRLDRARALTFLQLAYARRSFSDYPRSLEVAIEVDGSFRAVFSGGVVAELGTSIAAGDDPPAIGIALPGVDTSAVRLRQTGRTPRQWYWSIHELRLWERPPTNAHLIGE